ncbi:MAG: diguanylate cyclase [Candidatus Omnitrophica bacterium]|nr:diguanylate cyclase [Candidatus Omnitrophota bacterium]
MSIFLYTFFFLLFLFLGAVSLFLSLSLGREEKKARNLLSENLRQKERLKELISEKKNLEEDYNDLYQRDLKRQHGIEELSASREIGIAVSSSIELREVLKVILKVVTDSVQTKETTIYLVREESEELYPKIQKIGSKIILEESIDSSVLEPGLLGMVRNRKENIILNSSYCFAPLIVEEKKILGLIKFRREDTRPFGEEERWFLENVSKQISFALRNALLYEKSVTDGLTKLYNHNHFEDSLQNQFFVSRRYKRKLSLLLLDIDHFKRFNDEYGHQTGDLVLIKLSQLIKKTIRDADRAYRYGGEEMVIILPDTAQEEASILGERLRRIIETHQFANFKGEPLYLTVSLGISSLTEDITKKEDLVWRADQALYQAKREGRNKTVLYRNHEDTNNVQSKLCYSG